MLGTMNNSTDRRYSRCVVGLQRCATCSDRESVAEFGHRGRSPTLLTGERRILASVHRGQDLERTRSSLVGSEEAVPTERVAARVAVLPVLHKIGLDPASHNSNAKSGHLVIENEDIKVARLQTVYHALRKLWHWTPPATHGSSMEARRGEMQRGPA